MMNLQSTWAQVVASLRECLTEPAAQLLVNSLQLVAVNDRQVTLYVDSQFNKSLVLKRQDTLKAVFGAVLGCEAALTFVVNEIESPAPYKNYNLNHGESYKASLASSSLSPTGKNYKNYKGLYAKIHSDPLYAEVFGWAPDEEKTGRMLYACIRDYGEAKVRESINRIKKLRDSYFRQGQPVPAQRFRLFCFEMNKLKAKASKAS